MFVGAIGQTVVCACAPTAVFDPPMLLASWTADVVVDDRVSAFRAPNGTVLEAVVAPER
jgi:hypothetical protein